MLEKIKEFLKDSDLDIRKSNYSRFIDQKVTPDVLCFIADCVDNLVASQVGKKFTTRDIWDSMYFKKNVEIFFKKPSADNKNASNEYDKFISQPLRMLNYAGVLESEKRGTRTREVLERVKNTSNINQEALRRFRIQQRLDEVRNNIKVRH